MDGEGTIRLQRSTSKYGIHYSIMAHVGMAEKGMPCLESLQNQYGGNITKTRGQTDRWAAAYSWRIFGAAAERFLRAIYPYLILKQRNAEVLLCFQDRMNRERQANGRVVWTASMLEAATIVFREITGLNRKGPPAARPPAGIPDGAFAFLVGRQWMTPQLDLWSQGWQPFSGRWPTSGCLRSMAAYERPTLARHIAGTAGGASPGGQMWPTPRGNENDQGQAASDAWLAAGMTQPTERNGQTRAGGGTFDTTLHTAAIAVSRTLWPTPSSMTFSGGEPTLTVAMGARGRKQGPNLFEAAARWGAGRGDTRLWSTPRASDSKSGQVSDEVYEKNSRPLTEQATRWMEEQTARAPWEPCPCCENFLCTIHEMHAHDCACPLIEEWETAPYSPSGHPSPTTPTAGAPSSSGGQGSPPLFLNPLFVEWLIWGRTGIGLSCLGHPATATEATASDSSGTVSAPRKRKPRSGCSGGEHSESGHE